MAKGAAYELEVADMVEDQLRRGNFGIDPALSVVRRKPTYYSRDRKSDIEFDVSIEVSRKGASEPFWIWIWECKNYSGNVPVDDVEEFHTKLSQVGADRTKGTIITPVGFGSGGVEFAQSKGIGLWRFVPPGTTVCLMEDSYGPQDADVIRALTTPDPTAFRDFGGFYGLTCDGRFTTEQNKLILTEFANAQYNA